ncbi:MAG TPA: serine hydrolase, partial [Candidatus Eisenbacteria bacterium]|nr:serine hydrolase [Candidatus Eisenbacteria bacterium]
SKYLPALRLADSLSPDRITLRDLLAMTHGIENNGPVTFRSAFTGEYTEDLLLRLMAAHGPASTGREFKYGNLGYNLAGFVLQAATGKGWKEIVETEVLRPIGMTRTTAWMSRATEDLASPYRLAGEGFVKMRRTKTDATMHAAGGHLSTAGDLARYLIVHLGRGRIDGREVVPAAAIAETHRMQSVQKAKVLDYERYGWGLGWDLGTYEADTLVHRFGNFNGSFCHLSFMPSRGIGVVVLASEDRAGGMLATMVANSIYDRLLEKPGAEEKWARIAGEAPAQAAAGRSRMAEDAKRRAARPQTTAHPLRAYVGEYENADLGRIRWTLNGDRLRATMGALESDAEIYDGTKDQVRVELTGSGEVVTFECEGETAKALSYQNARFERR